jgi:hypothetical protein
MTDKKRRPPKKRAASKSPYFLQPGKQGAVTVFRRPAGNRIDAKLCGTMASRAMALALVKQLEKAESVVHDLFLEATDDGIEALEAVLESCAVRRASRLESRPPGPPGHASAAVAAGAARRGVAAGPTRRRPASRVAPRTRAPPDVPSAVALLCRA